MTTEELTALLQSHLPRGFTGTVGDPWDMVIRIDDPEHPDQTKRIPVRAITVSGHGDTYTIHLRDSVTQHRPAALAEFAVRAVTTIGYPFRLPE